ncbi:MAG: hypothetical protein SPG32_04130 [Candidatus Ventricola sp.]|nr:hypothetical protein [Candidatus Ventricola sp.]
MKTNQRVFAFDRLLAERMEASDGAFRPGITAEAVKGDAVQAGKPIRLSALGRIQKTREAAEPFGGSEAGRALQRLKRFLSVHSHLRQR